MNCNNWTLRLVFSVLLLVVTSITLSAENEDRFRNKVNLALRQTSHNLLLSQNDSTSNIAPVKYEGSYMFVLQLERVINYDTLPYFLSQAFEEFNIEDDYSVSIKDCEDDVLFLGYSKASVEQQNTTCGGRDIKSQCANIYVQFYMPDDKAFSQLSTLPFWVFMPLVGLLLFMLYKKTRTSANGETDGRLSLGAYHFDPQNQVLVKGDEKISLTFRENKLLHLFANQPNKVLTRNEIMSTVWEDEGIIVGRSLDVFISRLRKLLNQDPAVQIKNVHGVGYRLELS